MAYRKLTPRNFETVATEVIRQFQMGSKDERAVWVDAFNRMLDELLGEDFFGTEGQNDPRGDHRS